MENQTLQKPRITRLKLKVTNNKNLDKFAKLLVVVDIVKKFVKKMKEQKQDFNTKVKETQMTLFT